MKKSKKLLSLFLAALMLMSCFGAISASAMTMDAAEAAAAEFNATIPDHSPVYANKSAKQWGNTLEALNSTLGVILKSMDLKSTIYSDATVNSLLPALGGALQGIDIIGSLLSPNAVAKDLDTHSIYPEISAYLKTITSWSEFDASKAIWGITPGDKAAFIDVLSEVFASNVGYLLSLVVGATRKGTSEKVYDFGLVPLLESLHQGTMPDYSTYSSAAKAYDTKKLYVQPVIAYLCNVVDAFLANPVSYLCEVLPDLVYTYPKFRQSLDVKILLFVDLGSMILPLLPENLDGILKMLTDALGMNLTLDSIDDTYLYTMGKAVVAESGRPDGYTMKVEGNQTMVFAAVAQYVQGALQNKDNQVEIGRFVGSKIGPEYEDNYLEIVEAAKNGTALDVADSCLSLVEEFATNIGAQEDVNPVVAFFAKIVKFFSDLAKKIIALFK